MSDENFYLHLTMLPGNGYPHNIKKDNNTKSK